MGMSLEALPWMLGGDRKAVLGYLEAAAPADPGYLHARLDLAKVHVKRNAPAPARRHLEIIVDVRP
jgi:hypothetical protein